MKTAKNDGGLVHMEEKITTEIKLLPVKLSDAEMASIGLQLCKEIKAVRKVEAEKKVVNDSFKVRIETHNGIITRLSDLASTEEEERKVLCEGRYNFGSNSYTLIRTDTGEEVMSRAITPEERQTLIDDTHNSVINIDSRRDESEGND